MTHEGNDDMITVMGASGNTGGAIARELLAAGEQVRVVGRSAERLADLTAAGAEPRAGDVTDPGFLTEAFRGATAAYTLVPIDLAATGYRAAQDRLGEAIAASLADAGVPHVVALSAIGAEVPADTGFLVGLHAQEERLRQLRGSDVLLLRAGSFFENLHGQHEVVRDEGIVADTIDPEVVVPMVSVRDVAQAAAEALLARDWHGVAVRELVSPDALTYVDVARVIGERLDRPEITYVQLPDEAMAAVLTGIGFSDEAAGLQIELNRAISEGRVRAGVEAGGPAAPTRFADFAAELAAAVAAA